MLKTYLTHSDIIDYEPRLDDYLGSDQDDYTDIIASAKEILTQDLKSNKLELKRLCVPLVLQESGAQSTSKSGAKSDQDYAERRIWVITATAIDGTSIFTLKGTNDESNETYTTVTTKVITEIGTYTVMFDDVYKYYAVDWSGTSCTYSSELVEESFFLAHLYLSLNRIYETLRANIDDLWERKAAEYMELYQKQITNISHTYDVDLDSNIDDEEINSNIRVTFRR